VVAEKAWQPLRLLYLLLGISISCGSTCFSQAGPSGSKASLAANNPLATQAIGDWKEFTSAEGAFSIILPGTPLAKVNELQTSVGKLNSHAFLLKLQEAYYHISYLDYPVYSEDDEFVKRTLDAGRDGMTRSRRTEILSERAVVLGNISGREFSMLQDRYSYGIVRSFVVHGRLYQVAILVPLDVAFKKGRVSLKLEDQTVLFRSISSRFFDSFKITERGTETLGEVDRMLGYLKEETKNVVIIVGSNSNEARSSGSVLNGRALHLVAPPYPAIARSAHASGQVSVKVLIDLEGNVAAAQAVDGHPLLRAAAIKAARETKFTPTQMNGAPVMVVGIIIYNFVAQ
jgi:TonB family protein